MPGTISFKELNKSLRRSLKAEKARQLAMAAAEMVHEEPKVEIVDIAELKAEIVADLEAQQALEREASGGRRTLYRRIFTLTMQPPSSSPSPLVPSHTPTSSVC